MIISWKWLEQAQTWPTSQNFMLISHLENILSRSYIFSGSSQLWLDVTADPWRIRWWSLKRSCRWMVGLHFSCTQFLQRSIGLAVLTRRILVVSHHPRALNRHFQKTFSERHGRPAQEPLVAWRSCSVEASTSGVRPPEEGQRLPERTRLLHCFSLASTARSAEPQRFPVSDRVLPSSCALATAKTRCSAR